MGQCCTRKKLVCHIQQQLINLNEEQLYRLADVLSGEISVNVPTITGTNGADLVEYILSLSQGVSQLLLVQDLITKMMGESDSNTTIMEKNTTQQESNIFGPSDTSTHISHDQDTDDVTIPDTANAGTSDTPPAGLMIGDPDIYTTTREKNTTQQESNIYGLSDTSTHTGHEQEPKDITVPDTTNAGTSDMPPACLMIGDPDIYTTTREKNTTQQESNIYGLSDTSTHTGHEQEPKDITVPDTTNAGTSDMPPAGLMIGDPDIYTTSREKNTTQQESNIFRLSDTSTHISRELDPEDVTVPETVNAGMSDGVSEKVKDEDANKRESTAGKPDPITDLFQRLGLLDFYPRKIQMEDILLIKNVPTTQPLTEKDLWFQYVNMVMMLDCRARHLFLRSPEDHRNIANTDDDVNGDEDFFTPDAQDTDTVPCQTHIHPMDLHMAVFHCSDNFVRQYLNGKLSTCQFALPLLIPIPLTEDIEFPAWALRQIKKNCKNESKHIFYEPVPMVTMMRLGSSHNSKSQIMSNIINKKKHPVFFNRHCTGSTNTSLLMDGLVEISWYCPGGRDNDVFDGCVAFINLHGDACKYPRQVQFLQEVSTAMILLLPDQPLNEEELKVAKQLQKVPVPLITLFSQLGNVTNNLSTKTKFKIAAKNRNEAELTEELVQRISECIVTQCLRKSNTFSLDECLDIVRKNNFKVDEDDKCCQVGKDTSQLLTGLLKELSGKTLECSNLKETLLPLQGTLWKEWCKSKKLQCRIPEMENTSIEQHVSKINAALNCSREKQLQAAKSLNKFMIKFVEGLAHSDSKETQYMLQQLNQDLDQLTTCIPSDLQDKYNKTCTTQRNKMEKSKLDENLNKISAPMNASAFTLTEIMREICQLYEAPTELKYEGKDKDWFDSLPSIGAEMLVMGYPLELMNGEVSHVPLTWLEAVFDKLIQKLGDKRIFVLSVLGVQSSGKSTLLNTMFGLQFAVSAGRCTSGAFMQLLKVDKDLKDELQYDFVLVIDSEGLRSPELSSDVTLKHDNELATFIIGIGDLTVINIMGENPSEMQDILQICAQAFLRMASVNIKPSCIFVHQNVAESTANDKNQEGRRLLEKRLNEIARLAAKEENRKAQCFSDIIQFDINTQVFYFKSLLEGDPPMATPNPSYSQNVQELKNKILSVKTWQKYCHLPSLTEFKFRVRDLWEALCKENFIFSFRNTLEVMVYTKLENHYSDWSWKLRKHALETQQGYLNKIKSQMVSELTKEELNNHLYEIYEKVTGEIEKYFKNEEHAQILVNWRNNMNIRFKTLKDELINEMHKQCEEMLNINHCKSNLDRKRTDYEAELLTKSRRLAEELKGKEGKLGETQMKEAFEVLWKDLQNKVEADKPKEKPLDIKTKVENILLTRFENVKNIIDKVQKKSIILPFNIKEHTDIQQNLSLWNKLKLKVGYNNHNDLNEIGDDFIRKILSDLTKNIEKKEKQKLDFQESFVHEILDLIKQNAKFPAANDIELKHDYIVRLSIVACLEAVNQFERIHKTFKKENDIITYLNSKKDDSFQIFKSFCKNASSVEFFVHFLCNHIKSAIQKVVPENVSVQIADKMKNNSPAFSSNRMNLENHIMDHLACKENFNDYMKFICNPKDFHEEYIKENVDEYCKGKETFEMLCTNVSSLVEYTLTTCDEVTEYVNEKNGTASMWLDELCSQLGKKMTISREDLKIIEKEDLEEKGRGYGEKDIERFSFLKSKIKSLIKICLENVKEDFKKCDKTNMIQRAGDILCEQLSGCWETCPFCKALCTHTIPCHDGLHSMRFHRCGILCGWHYKDTNIPFIDFCTTAVGSSRSFYPSWDSEKTIPFSKYKEAGEPYDKWNITADGSQQLYWKWFICRFQSDLEEKHKCKFERMGTIPEAWKTITKEDVLKELDVEEIKNSQLDTTQHF